MFSGRHAHRKNRCFRKGALGCSSKPRWSHDPLRESSVGAHARLVPSASVKMQGQEMVFLVGHTLSTDPGFFLPPAKTICIFRINKSVARPGWGRLTNDVIGLVAGSGQKRCLEFLNVGGEK